MGREIRRVPADWVHPKFNDEDVEYDWQRDSFVPMFDQSYREACKEWLEGLHNFVSSPASEFFWDYSGNPPEKGACYREREWPQEEATHYQMYETVSEGTPCTPHFATKEELVNYLTQHGAFDDQRDGSGPWTRRNAESFVDREYAPSLLGMAGDLKRPRDQGTL